MAPEPRPGLRGFVESTTPGQIEGWAFDPSDPPYCAMVQLRLGDAILAEGQADLPRPDLPRAGLGIAPEHTDHGFRFALRPEWAARQAELRVLAFDATGNAVALPPRRPATPPGLPSTTQMVQAIDRLFAQQHSLESRLQALVPTLPQAPEPDPQSTEQRLASLEAWVARLDERLAGLAPPARAAAPAGLDPRQLDPWQIVLIALLGLTSLGALLGFALALAL